MSPRSAGAGQFGLGMFAAAHGVASRSAIGSIRIMATKSAAENVKNVLGGEPLALYVHWPFCVSKCPYCDFNSHVRAAIDQKAWRDALLADLAHEARLLPGRTLTSIFFGGGTPSLMDPATVAAVIESAREMWPAADDIEITLEANPNSVEAARFADLAAAGVDRLSLGLQSFDDRRSPSSAARIRRARASTRWRLRNGISSASAST